MCAFNSTQPNCCILIGCGNFSSWRMTWAFRCRVAERTGALEFPNCGFCGSVPGAVFCTFWLPKSRPTKSMEGLTTFKNFISPMNAPSSIQISRLPCLSSIQYCTSTRVYHRVWCFNYVLTLWKLLILMVWIDVGRFSDSRWYACLWHPQALHAVAQSASMNAHLASRGQVGSCVAAIALAQVRVVNPSMVWLGRSAKQHGTCWWMSI